MIPKILKIFFSELKGYPVFTLILDQNTIYFKKQNVSCLQDCLLVSSRTVIAIKVGRQFIDKCNFFASPFSATPFYATPFSSFFYITYIINSYMYIIYKLYITLYIHIYMNLLIENSGEH